MRGCCDYLIDVHNRMYKFMDDMDFGTPFAVFL